MAQGSSAVNGHARGHSHDEENTPLLGGGSSNVQSTGPLRRLRTHLTQDISTHRCDLLLLACFTITGLLDSSSIMVWNSFVSMQTGNTIYVGLGIADPTADSRWVKAAISISCFCAGSFAFGRSHRGLGPTRRWVLGMSHLIQAVFVAASTIIVALDEAVGDDEPGTPTSGGVPLPRWQVGVPIALVAFQAGGQTVTSRVVDCKTMTSTVLTALYCDLFSDARLFAPPAEHAERNRRLAAPVCLLIGAVTGGVLGKTTHGIIAAMWTAVVLKLLLVLAWLVWKPAKRVES